MDLTASGNAISVTLMEEFRRSPPRFFTPDQNGRVFEHDPDKVNVCDRSIKRESMFPNSLRGIIKVYTESELQALTSRLLKNPIFFTVDIKRDSGDPCTKVHEVTRDALAVTVNTQHPHMQRLLNTQLGRGMEAMKRGRRFTVEFDFSPVFIAWMKAVLSGKEDTNRCGCGCYTDYSCEHAKITVTNSTEFLDWYACSTHAIRPWIICFPCCLMSFPCYRIQRALTVEDFRSKVSGVDATYWSGRVQLQNLEETHAHVLSVLAQEGQDARDPSLDMLSTVDVVTRAPARKVSLQGGTGQPLGQLQQDANPPSNVV